MIEDLVQLYEEYVLLRYLLELGVFKDNLMNQVILCSFFSIVIRVLSVLILGLQTVLVLVCDDYAELGKRICVLLL